MPTDRKISIGLITLLVAVLAIFAATTTADGQHSGVWKLNPCQVEVQPRTGAETADRDDFIKHEPLQG